MAVGTALAWLVAATMVIHGVSILLFGVLDSFGPVECGGVPMSREDVCRTSYNGDHLGEAGYEEMAQAHARSLANAVGVGAPLAVGGTVLFFASRHLFQAELRAHDTPALAFQYAHWRAERCPRCGGCVRCEVSCFCD
ncbi:hypothetical protein ACQEU5_21120 [Marinactinospora thermotolerans]|nr:hypothetical protein [Marinactinospora thermotolerans]